EDRRRDENHDHDHREQRGGGAGQPEPGQGAPPRLLPRNRRHAPILEAAIGLVTLVESVANLYGQALLAHDLTSAVASCDRSRPVTRCSRDFTAPARMPSTCATSAAGRSKT